MSAEMFPPIGDYGFLSDCHTAALIGPDAAVEWMCVPQFDGPSLFSRILDRRVGGAWELGVDRAQITERAYLPETLVLRTRWEGDGVSVTGHDFLATTRPEESQEVHPVGRLIRWLRCDAGRAVVHTRVQARPDYGGRDARWTEVSDGWREADGALLVANRTWEIDGAVAEMTTVLNAGESVVIALDYTGRPVGPVDPAEAGRLLAETVDAWRSWSAGSDYDGVGARQVKQSAVVLRGLLFDESDGLLAAPTTSLPEWPGGPRNWDYRYVWHRDAALVVLSLLRLGHEAEAGRYLRLLMDHCLVVDNDWLAPMFGIGGGAVPDETELDHLTGYAGSRPVRRGNGAVDQHQLDVYGHVLDAALAYYEVTKRLTSDELAELWAVAEMARRHWRDPDAGIWEVQGPERHWTHSKVYAWLCFDRAVRLAELVGDADAPVEQWRRERDEVRADILGNGYDAELGSFVQSYGSRNVDGSLLRIPLLGFLPGDDPRVLGTIDRIGAELGEADDLVRRYDPIATDDGMDSPEGAFLLCSFEMVSALVLARRVDEAERRFASLCDRAGSLGLYSEEMTGDGTMLGNYPQAFTHLALIQAALNLDEAGQDDALHAWADRRLR